MMERPMTTEELFNRIKIILKEKNKLPDILDYGLPTGNALPIKTCDFELKSDLAYGTSGGIYLELWIRFRYEDPYRISPDNAVMLPPCGIYLFRFPLLFQIRKFLLQLLHCPLLI